QSRYSRNFVPDAVRGAVPAYREGRRVRSDGQVCFRQWSVNAFAVPSSLLIGGSNLALREVRRAEGLAHRLTPGRGFVARSRPHCADATGAAQSVEPSVSRCLARL